uniref:Uncharacterized protein n=1 Tax=Arundo donax TaxID=35708 RepID=A0A0A9BYR3_ARUDO
MVSLVQFTLSYNTYLRQEHG